MSRDTGSRIFRASVAVMTAHVIFKFAGLVQAKVLGHYLDESTRELYALAFEKVVFLIFLIGEESLGPAFLPVFMRSMREKGEQGAWRFASLLLSIQFIVLAVITAVVMIRPDLAVSLLTDWTGDGETAGLGARAERMVRWMAPGLVFLSLGSTTYLILNGYKRFFLAALGDAAVKLLVVAAVVSAAFVDGEMWVWLCGGVVVGCAAKLGTHVAGMPRETCRGFRPTLDTRSPEMRAFLLLVAPLVLGIVFAKVRDGFNEVWVLSTLKEVGAISELSWGRKIFNAFGWLVPYAGSIAMYPFFCELVDSDDREEMARLVTVGCHIIGVLCTPIAALVVALSLPVTQLLYQGGHFDLAACEHAAVANACFTLALPFFALEFVFMQAFFSHRRMTTPIVLGLVFSAFSMLLSGLGVVVYGAETTRLFASLGLVDAGDAAGAAIATVALAFTLTRAMKTVALGALMKRFLPDLDGAHALSFGARVLLSGCAAAGAAWAVRRGLGIPTVPEKSGLFTAGLTVAPMLTAAGVAGIAAYAAALRLLCPAEWTQTVEWTRRRIADRRRGKNASAPQTDASDADATDADDDDTDAAAPS